MKKQPKNPVIKDDKSQTNQPKQHQIKVTHDNAPMLIVHYLQAIHGRLGYLIKLAEGKK